MIKLAELNFCGPVNVSSNKLTSIKELSEQICNATNFEASYKIVNMLGQTVIQGKVASEVNVSSLTEGVYFIEVSSGEEIVSKKFIKN